MIELCFYHEFCSVFYSMRVPMLLPIVDESMKLMCVCVRVRVRARVHVLAACDCYHFGDGIAFQRRRWSGSATLNHA